MVPNGGGAGHAPRSYRPCLVSNLRLFLGAEDRFGMIFGGPASKPPFTLGQVETQPAPTLHLGKPSRPRNGPE